MAVFPLLVFGTIGDPTPDARNLYACVLCCPLDELVEFSEVVQAAVAQAHVVVDHNFFHPFMSRAWEYLTGSSVRRYSQCPQVKVSGFVAHLKCRRL